MQNDIHMEQPNDLTTKGCNVADEPKKQKITDQSEEKE